MGEPTIAQKGPFIKEMQPGTYAWCACGLSQNQPLCDGSHRKTEFHPVIFRLDETKKAAFCGCKHTKNPPYCDGTHKNIS